jgi:hypothetical protein
MQEAARLALWQSANHESFHPLLSTNQTVNQSELQCGVCKVCVQSVSQREPHTQMLQCRADCYVTHSYRAQDEECHDQCNPIKLRIVLCNDLSQWYGRDLAFGLRAERHTIQATHLALDSECHHLRDQHT